MALVFSIVVAIFVGGLATPKRHVASRMIDLSATPDAVWKVIRDVTNYPDWRDEIQSVQIEPSADGGFRWTEVGRSKSLSYIALTDEPPHRFTSQIADQDLGYSGEWRYVITLEGSGTRLTITEEGEVANPVFRFFGTHFIGFTGSIDAYLRDLAAELGEHSKPQAVEA